MEIGIHGAIVLVLRMVVTTGGTSLPYLDDDLIEWFVVHVDDRSAHDDLVSLSDRALRVEPGQVCIVIFLFSNFRNRIEGAFGGRGGGWFPGQAALYKLGTQSAGDGCLGKKTPSIALGGHRLNLGGVSTQLNRNRSLRLYQL